MKDATPRRRQRTPAWWWVVLLLSSAPGLSARAPSGAPTLTGPRATAVFQADDFFLGRRNLENIKQGLTVLHDEVGHNPQDYEAWWRIGKFENFWARRTAGDEKIKHLDAGIEAGRKAVGLQPNRVEGHFWLGASLGLKAEEVSVFEGIRLIDPVRKEMEAVVRINPEYEEASGPRSLARIYYEAPFFKGGDKKRSVQLLEDCLKRYPYNSLTMLYLADSYLSLGRRAEARKMLESILALCPDPQYGPELADNQAEARKMLGSRGN